MQWGQQLDKCSNGFCHLKQLFPFNFDQFDQNNSLNELDQKDNIVKIKNLNDNQILKLANKKSLKKYQSLVASRVNSPKTSRFVKEKHQLQYQSPTKSMRIRQPINFVFSNLNNFKQNYQLVNHSNNTILTKRCVINNQGNFVRINEQKIKEPFQSIQQKYVNHNLRDPIINNVHSNQIRICRSNSPKINIQFKDNANVRLSSPIILNHQNIISHNKNNFNDQKDQWQQKFYRDFNNTTLNFKGNNKERSLENISDVQNQSDSSNQRNQNSKKSFKQFNIQSEDLWNQEKSNFSKKKNISVLQYLNPFGNFSTIQEENQFCEESRHQKITFNQQKKYQKVKSSIQNQHKRTNVGSSKNQQKRQITNNQIQKSLQSHLQIRQAQSISQFFQSNHRKSNDSQNISQTKKDLYYNQNEVSCEENIALKIKENSVESQIITISEGGITASESKFLDELNKNVIIHRKQFHQPSIALKIFQNHFKESLDSDNIILAESKHIISDRFKTETQYSNQSDTLIKQVKNKTNQQKQNHLLQPVCFQKIIQKDQIKNYDAYQEKLSPKAVNQRKQSNFMKKKPFQNIFNKINSQPRHRFINITEQTPHQQTNYQSQNKIHGQHIRKIKLHSIFNAGKKDQIVSSKYLIDANQTHLINSPRNINKHDESTIIGRQSFSKPLYKLL